VNVVFVVLDTVRKDRISVYNESVDFTENIEEFAENATVFHEAVAQAPWTLPSHASIFTGTYPWEHGATQKQLYLDTDETLLAERFKQKDYQTACFTSNTWISPYTGMTKGFDQVNNFFAALPSSMMSTRTEKIWRMLNHGKGEWFMERIMKLGEKLHWGFENSSKTPQAVTKAKNFVKETEDDFFLFVNLMDAHLPYTPPEDYKERHAPEVNISEVCQKAHDHNGGVDQADFEASRKLYDAEIDFMDDRLGELFEFFEEQDMDEDTVFVLVSDHGENLGEHDLFGHQFSVSEQLVNVPLMIKAPGLEDEDVDKQVELRELYDLIPGLANIDDTPNLGSGYAYGGYQYPRLDLKNIPEEKHSQLGKKLSFVRTPQKKLVASGEELEMTDLKTGSQISTDNDFVQRLENIGVVEQGKMLEDKDEKVKERLEDLGYL
jgi:arylsulfatase A-like enzyme